MSMTEWAKEEVALACKREAPDRKEGEWDYGCACYESALKAFESLMEDEHSGMSIFLTLNVLNKLVKGIPLTPIEDREEDWNACGLGDGDIEVFQHKRYSKLFKNIDKEGEVAKESYNCLDRFVIFNEYNDLIIDYMSLEIEKIASEYYPITLPFMPSKINIYVEYFDLSDWFHDEDADITILHIDRVGDRVVDRWFIETLENKNWLKELDKDKAREFVVYFDVPYKKGDDE